MNINTAEHVEIYERVTEKTISPAAQVYSRDIPHTSLDSYLHKHSEATYSGHPDNFFKIISRVCPKPGEFRSLSALEIDGGGLLLQSSWREAGLSPCSSLVYAPDLILKEKAYINDGEKVLGYVIARKDPV